MRTTLTIDDDVAAELKARLRQGGSLKQVINEALRRGLSVGDGPVEPLPPFVVEPFSSAFLPGVDPNRLNQLVDELETEDFLAKAASEEGD